ncbi:hypothetical protein FHU37_000888 [Allostreptomyces psammosilenae]|uniref:Uncharacterized protein n=1 Tax=Allostreptomyces psammosilenae TaxID=1892865 RepID=A0A852ZQB7_9ACTN|nr:hypothetical protein [Allostreptomyces psammosilenae]
MFDSLGMRGGHAPRRLVGGREGEGTRVRSTGDTGEGESEGAAGAT